MHSARATARYAKSLADLSSEKGSLDKVYTDMNLVHKTCTASRELSLLLKNPLIKTDKKQKILSAIFKGRISVITEKFILLLAARRREPLMESIAKSFARQYKQRKKILTAVITTAAGLDEDLKKKVLELVKSSTYSEIELIEKKNEKLIGGFTLQVNDKLVDASIARQIRKLTMTFSENPYIKEY